MRISLIIVTLALINSSLALEEPAGVPSTVKRIAEGLYEYGSVSIDAAKRQITFPAVINQVEGNVEYAVVHEDGKTHESLIATKVRSTELQVALLLCRFVETSKEAPDPKGKLGIWIDWKDTKAKPQSVPLHRWVYNGLKREALSKHVWLFTGVPKAKPGKPPIDDQSVIAIFNDPYAAINCFDPKSINDDLWYPSKDQLPEIDTPVTVRIAPFTNESTTNTTVNSNNAKP